MYEQGREPLHSDGVLTKSIDHSLTRNNSTFKLCEWENVV